MSDTDETPSTSGYELPWYCDRETFPDDETMWKGFTAQDYTLAYALGVDHNRQAEELVQAQLQVSAPELVSRVEFDSEMGCFFAYTKTSEDMVALAGVVASMVAQINPAAVPGDMSFSPAFIRTWNTQSLTD